MKTLNKSFTNLLKENKIYTIKGQICIPDSNPKNKKIVKTEIDKYTKPVVMAMIKKMHIEEAIISLQEEIKERNDIENMTGSGIGINTNNYKLRISSMKNELKELDIIINKEC